MSAIMEELHIREQMSKLIQAQHRLGEMMNNELLANYRSELSDIILDVQDSFELFFHYGDKYKIVDKAIIEAKSENFKLKAENMELQLQIVQLQKELEL